MKLINKKKLFIKFVQAFPPVLTCDVRFDIVDLLFWVDFRFLIAFFHQLVLRLSGRERYALRFVPVRIGFRVYDGRIDTFGVPTTLNEHRNDRLRSTVAIGFRV